MVNPKAKNLLILFGVLLFLLAGCNYSEGMSMQDSRAESQNDVNQNLEASPELSADAASKSENANNRQKPFDIKRSNTSASNFFIDIAPNDDSTVSFTAETYAQEAVLSWLYSLEIEIRHEEVYINGIQYEQVTPTTPIILSCAAERFMLSEYLPEIVDTLNAIVNSECCCVLQASENSGCGKQILVYKINGTYYFVRTYDNGTIMRVHRASI